MTHEELKLKFMFHFEPKLEFGFSYFFVVETIKLFLVLKVIRQYMRNSNSSLGPILDLRLNSRFYLFIGYKPYQTTLRVENSSEAHEELELKLKSDFGPTFELGFFVFCFFFCFFLLQAQSNCFWPQE
jgi:hypothetical protein